MKININDYYNVHTVIATFKHAYNMHRGFCTKVLSLFVQHSFNLEAHASSH